jgi:hypothetical protein
MVKEMPNLSTFILISNNLVERVHPTNRQTAEQMFWRMRG